MVSRVPSQPVEHLSVVALRLVIAAAKASAMPAVSGAATAELLALNGVVAACARQSNEPAANLPRPTFGEQAQASTV